MAIKRMACVIVAALALIGCGEATDPSSNDNEEEQACEDEEYRLLHYGECEGGEAWNEANREAGDLSDERNAEEVSPSGDDRLMFCDDAADGVEHHCKVADGEEGEPCMWAVGYYKNADEGKPMAHCLCDEALIESRGECD